MRRALPALALALALGLVLPALPASAHDGHEHAAASGRSNGQPQHVDPAPKGVDVHEPVSTGELIEQSGVADHQPEFSTRTVAQASPGAPRMAAAAQGTTTVRRTALSVPGGKPGNPALTQHFAPSCSGTGTDGKRVQVLYAYESQNRLDVVVAKYGQTLRAVLLSAAADVDDTFALSSAAHNRRVRWVHDASCVPVVRAVLVPRGTITRDTEDFGLGAIRAAAAKAGVPVTTRKLLTFADSGSAPDKAAQAAAICGVGQIYPDDRATSSNVNNTVPTMVARVDQGCWLMEGYHSTPAHELMHMLGGVQDTAPNSTSYNHCTDEYDVMCYEDGGQDRRGLYALMRLVCKVTSEVLFDCGKNDYYNSGTPTADSYLDTHWNTSDSGYLDAVDTSGRPVARRAPVGVVSAAAGMRPGAPLAVRLATDVSASVRWTSSRSDCLLSSSTRKAVTLACPTTASGAVRLTAALTGRTGLKSSVTRTAAITASGTSTLKLSLATPKKAYVGKTTHLTATARWGSKPVRAVLTLQRRSSSKKPWKTVSTRTASTSGQASFPVLQRTSGKDSYRVLLKQSHTAGWRTAKPVTKTLSTVRRGTTISATLSKGHPDSLKARLRTATGSVVAHAKLTLQSRRAGSSSWKSVTSRRTSSAGLAKATVQPRHKTSYRWVYQGSTSRGGSKSKTLVVFY